ncbi:MAG: preprotein translocase subunit YajC [Ruminococcus sp.]|nr:preprotein translocase subunit YajC [Ruminococcus sp.]MDD5890097.1 preprotein translocase subunit YajC [Ruminococcus sp.]
MNLNLLSGSTNGSYPAIVMIIIWFLIFVGFYFILIRPKSKRAKQEQELRNSLQIGDEITTIGGIVGRVIAIREEADEIVLETGSEKTKMVFKRWAISTVNSDKDKPAEKTDKTEKKGLFGRKKKDAEESPAEK